MRHILFGFSFIISQSLMAAGPPVFVDEAKLLEVQTGTSVAGRLVAGNISTLSAQIAESVIAVSAAVGDRVKAGAELVRLDDTALKNNLQALQIRKEYLLSSLNLLKQRETVRARQLDRAKSLTNRDLLTRDATEQAELNLIQTRSDIEKTTFDIEDLTIKISDMMRQLSQTIVRTKTAGRVIEANVNRGQYVRPGDKLFSLIPDSGIEVEVDLRPEAYEALKVGQVIRGRLRGNSYALKVRALLAQQNQRTGSRVARLLFAQAPEVALVLGESIDLKLPLGELASQVTVAKDAVIPGKKGHRVVLVVDGKAEYRRVELGDGVGDRIVVLQGVKPGDIVVTQGQDGLRKGQEVSVVKDKT
jgi:membrane fusion protein (multidrug efflux system)